MQVVPCRSLPVDECAMRSQRSRRQRLGIDFGETAADGRVTLEAVYCLGNCACAPSTMVDGHLHGALDARRFDELADDWGVPE